jgi:hypothetical protein
MVLKHVFLWVALVALVSITSCKEDIDTTPPESPNLLPHTVETDTLPAEIGTDALPECNCIMLQWIPNREGDLREYEIFRSLQPEEGFVSLTVIAKNESTFTDPNLLMLRYYYYMTAKDLSGNVSEPSATVNYALTVKAVPKVPAKWDTVHSDSVRFEWDWDGAIDQGMFHVRLYSLDADSTCWMGWVNVYDTTRAYSPLLTVGDYKWRVDYIRPDSAGSESNWIPFYKR